MAVETPWHSTLPGTEVYHNNSSCTEGNNIERWNLEKGTGGKKICAHCARLANLPGMAMGLFGGTTSLIQSLLAKRPK